MIIMVPNGPAPGPVRPGRTPSASRADAGRCDKRAARMLAAVIKAAPRRMSDPLCPVMPGPSVEAFRARTMIAGSSGRYTVATARDHETVAGGRGDAVAA